MKQIFISYEKHDHEVAGSLCAYLEQNGYACWIAPRDIVAGEDYAGEIIRGVKSSGALVLVCSGFTKDSGHVLNEVSIAFDQKIQIIPYSIDDAGLGDSMDYYLAAIHRIISTGDREKDFRTIIETLENCRGASVPKAGKKKTRHFGIIAILAAIAIAALAAAAVNWFRHDGKAVTGTPPSEETAVPEPLGVAELAEVPELTEVPDEPVGKPLAPAPAAPAANAEEAQPASPAKEEPVEDTLTQTSEAEEVTEQPVVQPEKEAVPEARPLSLRESLAAARSLSELEGAAEYYHVTINTSAATLASSYLLVCSQDGTIKYVLTPQDANGLRVNLLTGEQVDRVDYSKGNRVEYVKP